MYVDRQPNVNEIGIDTFVSLLSEVLFITIPIIEKLYF